MNLKFAFRSLRRSPGFALLSLLILALGIGANTAIFSVVYGVVLKPLHYGHPEQLVSISMAWPDGFRYGQVSGPDFLDLRADSQANFQSMAAYANEVLSIVANGKSEFTGAAVVSEDFLRTMGVQPFAGRAFVSSDFTGHPRAALVSAGFWRRHFGDVPFSAGHLLKAVGQQVEIVGLLPPGFHFPEASNTEAWVPFFERLQNTNRGAHNYHVLGRLRPNSSVEQAQAQLTAIASRLEKAYPGTNKKAGVYVTSLSHFTARGVETSLYILLLAVALVLVIACANIANLLLVRGSARLRELAVRTALGASRARLVQQLLTETLLLAGGGTGGGILLAYLGLPVLLRWAPAFVPRLDDIQMNGTVLCICGTVGLLASVLFGLAPAIHASRVDPHRDLRSTGSRGVIGGPVLRLRQIFVTAQVALCLVLLVSAGLLLRSFTALTLVDLGFRPANLLVAHISVPEGERSAAVDRVFTPLLEQTAADPSVVNAAISRSLPNNPDTRSTVAYIIPGQTLADMNTTAPQAGVSVISGSYFETVGIPLLSGRTFSTRDGAAAPLTVVVNQALVNRSFPKQNPIGLKILCGYDQITMKWMTVVGIVADARLDGPKAAPMPEIYLPYQQHPNPDMNFLVKTRTDPIGFAQPVRSLTRSLDPEATLKFTTMESHLAATVATPRFSSVLISAFAGLAILLAAIGIYGVMAYSVTQRTAEIGLRMALGAHPGEVLAMILREALRLAGGGLLIGFAGSIAAARLLRSQLFEISPFDPAVYGIVLLLLLAVALLAAFLPAWRASQVEPIEALRQE